MSTEIHKRTHQFGPDGNSHIVDIYYSNPPDECFTPLPSPTTTPLSLGRHPSLGLRPAKKAIVFIGGGGWQGFDHFHNHGPLAKHILSMPLDASQGVEARIMRTNFENITANDTQHQSQQAQNQKQHIQPNNPTQATPFNTDRPPSVTPAPPSTPATPANHHSISPRLLHEEAVFCVLHHRPAQLSTRWLTILITLILLLIPLSLLFLSYITSSLIIFYEDVSDVLADIVSSIAHSPMLSPYFSVVAPTAVIAPPTIPPSSSSILVHTANLVLSLYLNLLHLLNSPLRSFVTSTLDLFSVTPLSHPASSANPSLSSRTLLTAITTALTSPTTHVLTRSTHPSSFTLPLVLEYSILLVSLIFLRFVISRLWHLGGRGGDKQAGSRRASPGLLCDLASGIAALQGLLPLYGADSHGVRNHHLVLSFHVSSSYS